MRATIVEKTAPFGSKYWLVYFGCVLMFATISHKAAIEFFNDVND